jgi:hypothetical protein
MVVINNYDPRLEVEAEQDQKESDQLIKQDLYGQDKWQEESLE